VPEQFGGKRNPKPNKPNNRTNSRRGNNGRGRTQGARNGNGKGRASRKRDKTTVPGFIDKRLTRKNTVEQVNTVWNIANWYKSLLNSIDWDMFKLLNEKAGSLHVPLEVERMVRDLHSTHTRITQYYSAAKSMFYALQKQAAKNETGYFTDLANQEVKLSDDPSYTTRLFLNGQLLFGPIELRSIMHLATNRAAMRNRVAEMWSSIGSQDRVRVQRVMTRVDYDQLANVFYAHYELIDSPGDFVVTLPFTFEVNGVLKMGRPAHYSQYMAQGRGQPLVIASPEEMQRALGYTVRRSTHIPHLPVDMTGRYAAAAAGGSASTSTRTRKGDSKAASTGASKGTSTSKSTSKGESTSTSATKTKTKSS